MEIAFTGLFVVQFPLVLFPSLVCLLWFVVSAVISATTGKSAASNFGTTHIDVTSSWNFVVVSAAIVVMIGFSAIHQKTCHFVVSFRYSELWFSSIVPEITVTFRFLQFCCSRLLSFACQNSSALSALATRGQVWCLGDFCQTVGSFLLLVRFLVGTLLHHPEFRRYFRLWQLRRR